jgi:hypothetical protein
MARPLLTTYLLTTPPGHLVVSAMLDGEERAHDRGDPAVRSATSTTRHSPIGRSAAW